MMEVLARVDARAKKGARALKRERMIMTDSDEVMEPMDEDDSDSFDCMALPTLQKGLEELEAELEVFK